MPNSIKYSETQQTLALKKGDFYIGTGDVGKGPTSTTGYFNGITPSAGGYTIYLNKASQGPSIYTAANDAGLIVITNLIAAENFTTVAQCLNYFVTQTDKMCFNKDYPIIETNGLVLNYDAGFTPSYPRSGTVWYDVSSGGNNGTLINGATFNSGNGGSIVFDGSNDSVNGPSLVPWFSNSSFTIESWFNFSSSPPAEQLWFSANPSPSGGFQEDIHLRVIGGTGLRFGFFADDLNASNVVSHSQWFQVICNYNFATDISKMYVNSVEVASGNQGPYTPVNANIGIGYWINRNVQYFKGNIAITLVYNRTLSASEILQNYNSQKSRFGL